jgi:hypothetical protein
MRKHFYALLPYQISDLASVVRKLSPSNRKMLFLHGRHIITVYLTKIMFKKVAYLPTASSDFKTCQYVPAFIKIGIKTNPIFLRNLVRFWYISSVIL